MQATADSYPASRLIKPAEVATVLGVSVRKVWRMTADGDLPRPVHIGRRSTRWREADLLEYLANL